MGPTKFTETTIVVWTFYLAAFRVSIETFLSGRAEAILGKPPAFWHTTQIVLMQELACVRLFAQSAQPMLTNLEVY
jgi:hypothetical protein